MDDRKKISLIEFCLHLRSDVETSLWEEHGDDIPAMLIGVNAQLCANTICLVINGDENFNTIPKIKRHLIAKVKEYFGLEIDIVLDLATV